MAEKELKMKSNDDKMKVINIRTGEEKELNNLKGKIKRYVDTKEGLVER
jgi:hypothetical protein